MSVKLGLSEAPEYPAGQRPANVQAVERPHEVLCKATSLAFLMFEKRDLHKAKTFWTDFGLNAISHSPDKLVMRAAGTAPAVLVAKQAPRSRYVGAAFVVPEDTDFARLQRESGATPIPASEIPGGGEGVCLQDPDGHALWLIRRWGTIAALPMRPVTTGSVNGIYNTPRVNATVRTPIEPAQIARLGHVVMQSTDFNTMANWYMRHLGLIPTDVQYLPDGSTMLTFFRLDLGATPADHHTVVIAGGIETRYEHSAWEVLDIDALGQGQQVMRARGHQHMWGIGRHVLGSQLFDYWYDDDGYEFEHYTDGDVFTADHETHYVPFSTGSIWAWGDDVPASMFPKKSLRLIWKANRLIAQGRTSVSRLRMIGGLVDTPARPWL